MDARAVVCAVSLTLLCAPAAGAATVKGPVTPSGSIIQFDAAPGETNAVTIARESPGSNVFVVSDAGAVLQAIVGCVARDPHTVTCAVAPSIGGVVVMANLGDGNDSLTLQGDGFGLGTDISGGPGDDAIAGACEVDGDLGNDSITLCDHDDAYATGGPGNDTVIGGAGSSVLRGGGGRDVLHGGAGIDDLSDSDGENGAPEDADVLDGGPGTDTLWYGAHKHGVTVNLAAGGPAGAPGEGDTVTGIENVTGTNYADTLIGDDGPNMLIGGLGVDTIDGAGGDDAVEGGPGADTIDGGGGSNEIYARDQFRDHIRCGGAGHLLVDPQDDKSGNCSVVDGTPLHLIRQDRLREQPNGTVNVLYGCNELLDATLLGISPPCPGKVSLVFRTRRGWIAAGSASCELPADCSGAFTIKLNKTARRLLERKRRLAAGLTFTQSPGLRGGALPERHVFAIRAAKRRR